MEHIIGYPVEAERNLEKDIASLHPFSVFNSQTSRPMETAVIVAMGRDRDIGGSRRRQGRWNGLA